METEPTRTPDVLTIPTTKVSLSVCSVKLTSFDHICLTSHVRINFFIYLSNSFSHKSEDNGTLFAASVW